MFNKDFYPTPASVIKQMIEPYKKELANYTILDPSAGKGNILDAIKDLNRNDLYAIEIDPELRFILSEKKYKVIAEDFLEYNGDHFFDLILMNPPFSNADKHLLHAWKILHNGEICCLVNHETLANPYTETRKLLMKIIEDNDGTIEYLGDPFIDAERKTSVKVAMVRLKKKAKESKFKFKFNKISSVDELELPINILENQIATNDVIGNMMIQFEKLRSTYIEEIKIRSGLRFYSQGLLNEYSNIDAMIHDLSGTPQQKFNRFCDLIKMELWKKVITRIGLDRYMTHRVYKDFREFIQVQGYMDFTRENVQSMIRNLFANVNAILESAIVDVFDLFTAYHKENRVYQEGWKTNDKWKVNKKVILPGWVRYGEYMSQYDLSKFGDRMKVNWSYNSEYDDIDKVMCYITGEKYETCYTLYRSLENKFEVNGKIYPGKKYDNTGESDFFRYKFYKKGTLHIEFKDKYLWQEFNMRACAEKKWLPEKEEKAWKEKKNSELRFAVNQ